MSDNENMEIEEPEEWEEPDDLIEEELEIGESRKVTLAEAVKGFFTGLLFKSILVALILHVILIGLTSLGMLLNKPVPAEGQDKEKKTVAEETEKKTEDTKKEETSEETEKKEDNGEKTEKTSTDETTKKEEKPKDETKPTGNPEDYLKKLETITPDKAPVNPLETKGDELE